ncbi:MAG: HEPN domain-containing protein [Clostridiales bacterium]|jgi:HEPN domain-containing protein|nr:HEPN domain-containing protein [Clostridiales bacterium]
METKLTYKYIGDRDLADAKILLESGSASMTGRLVQQAVEKNLKQYIEDNGTIDDLPILSAHNTVKLYDRVAALGGVINNPADRKMMALLREYYYDTNYPGEDCRELSREEAAEAVSFAAEFIAGIKF